MSSEFGDLNIPFRHVRYSVFRKLADKLDTESSVNGNNWRMLADRLGYTTEQICVFEVQQATHGRNTIKVLQDYSCSKADATVGAVYRALQEIDRPDALSELKAAIPDIKKDYEESRHKNGRTHDVTENEYMCKSCEGNPYMGSPISSYHPSLHGPSSTGVENYMYPSSHHQHHVLHSHSNHTAKNYQRHKSMEPPCRAPRLPDYDQSSPEFKRQRSMPPTDSMLVRGHDSNSQYYHNHETMDHSPSIRENGVPPALAMLRGMARFNDINVNPVKSSIQSVNDSVFRQPFAQGQIHSSIQSHHNPQARPQLKLDMPKMAETYNLHHNDFISPSPSTPSTPLEYLKHLAHERHIQPTEDFRLLMKLKQEEELLQGKAGLPYDPFPSPMNGGCRDHMFAEGQGCSKQRSPNGPPNTFPLRLKSDTRVLTKSASVPENIKPGEFVKRAFRHIKVFVTYASDDTVHTKRVLKLCECLEKNGFRCCVDIFQRKLPDDKKQGWHREKFEEADFILVVMSPRYRHETDSCNVDNNAEHILDSDSEDKSEKSSKLHTKDIYRLMYREYMQSDHRPQRFVPLVFPGMTQDIIPSWLIDSNNKPFYFWPDQYKDLLWMLTKPENRVPDQSLKSDTEESSHQECDVDVEEEGPE